MHSPVSVISWKLDLVTWTNASNLSLFTQSDTFCSLTSSGTKRKCTSDSVKQKLHLVQAPWWGQGRSLKILYAKQQWMVWNREYILNILSSDLLKQKLHLVQSSLGRMWVLPKRPQMSKKCLELRLFMKSKVVEGFLGKSSCYDV